MKTKKIFGVAALTAVAAASLASCGGGSSANEIEFYTSMGDEARKILDPMVEEFNKTSEIKVKVTNPGGGYDGVKNAVNAAIQGNKQPAIAYAYSDHVAEYLPTGKVLNMMDFINGKNGYSEEEKNDFIKGFWEEGYKAFGKEEKDNVMYTLPFSKSTEVMYYNPVALQALYPEVKDISTKVPTTWEELWQIAKDLKATDKKVTYGEKSYSLNNWYALGYDSENNWFITNAEQNGFDYTTSNTDNHYTFNNENNVNFLNDLKTKFDAGYFTTQQLYGSYTSNLFTKPDKSDSSTIFSIGSSAGASHQKSQLFDAEVAMLPQSNKDNPKSISQGPSLVMLKQSSTEKEEAAWKFVKALLDPVFQAKFAKAQGYMPVRVSCTEDAEFAAWLKSDDLIAKTMNLAIEQRKNYFVSPAFNGSNKAREQVGAALIAVLSGKRTGAEALKDAFDECDF